MSPTGPFTLGLQSESRQTNPPTQTSGGSSDADRSSPGSWRTTSDAGMTAATTDDLFRIPGVPSTADEATGATLFSGSGRHATRLAGPHPNPCFLEDHDPEVVDGLRASVRKDACDFNKSFEFIRSKRTNPISTAEIDRRIHNSFVKIDFDTNGLTLASNLKTTLSEAYDELGKAKRIIDEDAAKDTSGSKVDLGGTSFGSPTAIHDRKNALLGELEAQVQLARESGIRESPLSEPPGSEEAPHSSQK
ncbi:hypothetical protein IAT40_004101 [Kwoniella sp. CBS 6097]